MAGGGCRGYRQMFQKLTNLGRERGAGRRQPYRAGRPRHQLHAEMIFEIADGTADGPVGQVKLFGCPEEAQMPGGRLEGRQRAERRETTTCRRMIDGPATCECYSTTVDRLSIVTRRADRR